MSGNAAFTVPMDRQRVLVRLHGGTIHEGDIFIEQVVADLSPHEKITTFLENEISFFPLKLAETGKAEFLNKSTIISVEVAVPENPEETFFSCLILHTIPVRAHCVEGTILQGLLTAEVPQERERLSDCLNMQNAFLCIQEDKRISYINKKALLKVEHADAG